MIVDASAVLALVLEEADCDVFAASLSAATSLLISPVNLFEALTVASSRRANGGWAVRELLEVFQIEVAALEPRQAELAFEAHRRFGKGRHPAALNLGDCFAYALAQQHGAPLLFKGEDFRRTDVRCAV